MNEYLTLIILGAVQGLTEFLPISSDGHLVVASEIGRAIFGEDAPRQTLGLTILLHLGTLLAILVFFGRRVVDLITSDRRVIPLLIVGTLPAVALGLPLKLFGEEALVNPIFTGLMLPLTGVALLWSKGAPAGDTPYQQITYGQAILIGCFQALAILPGISRSGMTIAIALRLGIRREDAAVFSFLLAIPAIAGAGVLEVIGLSPTEARGLFSGPNLVGTFAAFVVGLAALAWLLNWLRQGRLHYFAYWVIPLGVAFTLWQTVVQ